MDNLRFRILINTCMFIVFLQIPQGSEVEARGSRAWASSELIWVIFEDSAGTAWKKHPEDGRPMGELSLSNPTRSKQDTQTQN